MVKACLAIAVLCAPVLAQTSAPNVRIVIMFGSRRLVVATSGKRKGQSMVVIDVRDMTPEQWRLGATGRAVEGRARGVGRAVVRRLFGDCRPGRGTAGE